MIRMDWKCEKIGELNKIGIEKTYSCREYAKIDKKFTKDKWCYSCQMYGKIIPSVTFSQWKKDNDFK